MPVYTYRREDGTTFDIRQRFSDETLGACPATGQKVTRVIQAAGLIFKGSGFYVNDSKKSANGNQGKPAEKDAADKNGTKADSVSAEKKDDSAGKKNEKAAAAKEASG